MVFIFRKALCNIIAYKGQIIIMKNKFNKKKNFIFALLVPALFISSYICGYKVSMVYNKTFEKAYNKTVDKISKYIIIFEENFIERIYVDKSV